jgi:DNA-binding response OmpR family regulator
MNILLLNTNPVVSRLLSLCIRKEDMVLEEITDLSMVKLDKYDIAFIDDNAYEPEVQDLLQDLMIGKKIFLAGKQGNIVALEAFDEVITKPFLPSQITAAIERFSNHAEEKEEHEEERFIFPLSQEERKDETVQTEEDSAKEEKESIEISQDPEVLDSNEIERIKALLEEEDEDDEEVLQIEDEEAYEARKVEVITEHLEADGLEIISEDEIVSLLSTKPKKKKMNKKKTKKAEKKRSKKAEKEETYTFEEALIAAIEGMKPKKIKKLLKDAEVTIKINFKDKK